MEPEGSLPHLQKNKIIIIEYGPPDYNII